MEWSGADEREHIKTNNHFWNIRMTINATKFLIEMCWTTDTTYIGIYSLYVRYFFRSVIFFPHTYRYHTPVPKSWYVSSINNLNGPIMKYCWCCSGREVQCFLSMLFLLATLSVYRPGFFVTADATKHWIHVTTTTFLHNLSRKKDVTFITQFHSVHTFRFPFLAFHAITERLCFSW